MGVIVLKVDRPTKEIWVGENHFNTIKTAMRLAKRQDRIVRISPEGKIMKR